MKRLKTELNALVNRGVDRHLRLAVTGLSRSGKTAFITALVNQLLNIHTGARLPLLSAAREERLLGVKRVPQRDFGIPRFTYDEGLAQLYGQPPMWPTPTRGVSEIRLALRYRSNDSLLRHFKAVSYTHLDVYKRQGLRDGAMMASSDTLHIEVKGVGGHGAVPEHTVEMCIRDSLQGLCGAFAAREADNLMARRLQRRKNT